MNKTEQIVYGKSGVEIEFDWSSITDFNPQRMYYYTLNGVAKDLRIPLYFDYTDIDIVSEMAELILEDIQQGDLFG